MRKTNGFTIIEVIIAILILTVITVGIIGFFPYYMGVISRMEQRLMAVNLARQTMERISWNPFLDAVLNENDPFPDGALGNARNPARSHSVRNDITNSYWIITVTMSWD